MAGEPGGCRRDTLDRRHRAGGGEPAQATTGSGLAGDGAWETTAIRALAQELTAGGKYAALTFTCEHAKVAEDNYGNAERIIVQEIWDRAEFALPADLRPPPWPEASEGRLLKAALMAWARACPLPLVLFSDEIDALRGQTLISVLSQLRAGYNERPHAFPASVVLCGLRDVRDYKAASGGDPTRLGTSSPFNIKLESLRIGDSPRTRSPSCTPSTPPTPARNSHLGRSRGRWS